MPIVRTGEAYYKRTMVRLPLVSHKRLHHACISTFSNIFQKTQIILLSDTCSGQNRNVKMALMFKIFLCFWKYSDLKLIEQQFYVPGHSYNDSDRSFGTIDRFSYNGRKSSPFVINSGVTWARLCSYISYSTRGRQ